MRINPASSIKLDSEMNERVQQLASAQHRSADLVLREAVEQYVNREEKRAQFYKDAQASWADYEATGLHVTGDEVDAWLAKLEAGEDALPPECHL